MSARIQRSGEQWSISGDMTFATASQLLMQGETLFGTGGDMVVDFDQVQRTDSAGLVLILEWMERARQRGDSIQFKNIPASILGIAELSNIRELLPQASS